jgi:CheY-like chemotaxis protein
VSKRILVVEDQPDNRQIIRDMLAPADYEITEDGEEALAAIAKQRPDLILMDIQLPVMDGYTATAKLIRRCDRSRSSRSPPMCSASKKRRRERQAAMTMCRNLLARANCYRKFVST